MKSKSAFVRYLIAFVVVLGALMRGAGIVFAESPPDGPPLSFKFGLTCSDNAGGDAPVFVVQSGDDEVNRFNGRVGRWESSDGSFSWQIEFAVGGDDPQTWRYVMGEVAAALNGNNANMADVIGQEGNAWLNESIDSWASAPTCEESGWFRTDNPGRVPTDPYEFFWQYDAEDNAIFVEGNFPDGGFDMSYMYIKAKNCHTWTIARSSGGRYDFAASYTTAKLNGLDPTSLVWAVPGNQRESYGEFLDGMRASHPTCPLPPVVKFMMLPFVVGGR